MRSRRRTQTRKRRPCDAGAEVRVMGPEAPEGPEPMARWGRKGRPLEPVEGV